MNVVSKIEYKNKLIHTADIHFSKENYKDVINPFMELLDYIKKERPKYVCLTGDYYDKVINTFDPLYVETINYLIEISNYCKYFIILRGTLSHDYYNLNILRSISKIKNNIYFFDTKTKIKIEDNYFLILPEEYKDNMEDYYKDIYEEEYDIILGHGMLSDAKLHSGIDNVKLKTFKFYVKKLEEITKKVILFGHIHIPQKILTKTYYCGSLGRYRYGEEEDKGFFDYNLDTNENNFIITRSSTKYETIKEEDLITKSEEEIIKILKENEKIRYKGDKNNDLIKHFLEKINKNINELKIVDTNKNDKVIDFLENNLIHKFIENKSVSEQYLEIRTKDIEKIKNKKQKNDLNNDKFKSKLKEMIETCEKQDEV